MSQDPNDNQPQSPAPPYGYNQPQSTEPQSAYAQAQPVGAPVPPVAPGGAAQAASSPRRSRAWIVAVVAIVCLCLVSMFGIWSCSSAFVGGFADDSSADIDLLAEDAVGIIELDGSIDYDGTTCSPDGLKAQLDEAASNDHIKAVVLRINSGGGVATAGEEMTEYVREFKEETGKPVVVSSAAINASAAYEISSQADCIFTAKTTSIGGIGTAMQLVSYGELLDMLGISVDNITSSDSKDSTYGSRKLTDKERAYYQAQVDQINECFISNVASGRGMDVAEVRKLATGLTFTGVDAVENGLADEIGTKEDAIDRAAELAGLYNYTTVSLEPYMGSDLSALLDLLAEEKTSGVSAADVAAALKELEEGGTLAK